MKKYGGGYKVEPGKKRKETSKGENRVPIR